jgi:hypothetical protein
MRWVAVMLLCGCGVDALPCEPKGTFDFFLVRSAGLSQSGTFTSTGNGSATLAIDGEPARACTVSYQSDDRGAPIASCQIGWSCAEPECASCASWRLGLLYRPAEDGVLPQGTVTTADGGIGAWSAAPVSP